MRRQHLAILMGILVAGFLATTTLAGNTDADTDNRFVNAKVVEVTEHRISIIARTGVEHVIAIDDESTKVVLKGEVTRHKDLKVGDIVTVELDEKNPLKFARSINIAGRSNSQVAER